MYLGQSLEIMKHGCTGDMGLPPQVYRDSLLQMERSWKKVTGTGSGVVPRYTIDMMLGTPIILLYCVFIFVRFFPVKSFFLQIPGGICNDELM